MTFNTFEKSPICIIVNFNYWSETDFNAFLFYFWFCTYVTKLGITDATISHERKLPSEGVISMGPPLKTRAHSSNRSDLFYGTEHMVILRKISQDNLQMLFQPTWLFINLVYTASYFQYTCTVPWQIHLMTKHGK